MESSSDESGSDDSSAATNPKENETALNSAARKVFAEICVPSNNVIKMGAKAGKKVGTSKAQNPKKKAAKGRHIPGPYTTWVLRGSNEGIFSLSLGR